MYRSVDAIPSTLDLLVSNLVSHSFALKDINQAFELAEWQGKNSGTAATRVIRGP